MNTYLIKSIFVKFRFYPLLFLLMLISNGCSQKELSLAYSQTRPQTYSQIKPQIIELDLPTKDNKVGGLITADVDDDGQKDFIITKPGHITVYNHSGKKLWVKQIDIQVIGQSEKNGLPGWHAAGVQAADIDGDKQTEVLFLTKDKTLQIVQG